MKVYAPMWFDVKINPSCGEGAKHLFRMISRTREFSVEVRQVIEPVIERNAYFAHMENLILSLLTDEDLNVRRNAKEKIMVARAKERDAIKTLPPNIRTFNVPKLNFNARQYNDLICPQELLAEPPIMKNINVDNDEELRNFLSQFPCHTQAVERAVKLTTEAASKVCGEENRDGYIRATIESRKVVASFGTKRHYFGD
jgi:hypothetical protein